MTTTNTTQTIEVTTNAGDAETQEGARMIAYKPNPTEPTTFDHVMVFCGQVAKSKMFGVKTDAEAFVRVATGQALGLSAIASLNLIDAIPGADGSPRPSLRAKLKTALCMRSPLCEYFRCTETTNERATYVTKRKGNPERSYTYTIKDAETAGLYPKKDNWKNHPGAMLRARASSALADIEFPDVTNGIETTEERYDQARTVDATEWTVVPVGPEKADGFAGEIAAVATPEALGELWNRVKAAKAAGDITEDQFADLKAKAGWQKKNLAPQPATGTTPPNGTQVTT